MFHAPSVAAIFASTLGQIFQPVFKAFSWVLALFYSWVPNYAFAIAMLTLVTMVVSYPLNRASTRSMVKMQLLQPEMQKLRNKYKVRPDMTVAEKQEVRARLNEEMVALYRDNGASMTGGCLPMVAVFPIFLILYQVIRGLTNTTSCKALASKAVCLASNVKLPHGATTHMITVWSPRYIITGTQLYHDLKAANGKMLVFGLNFADSVRSEHGLLNILPFALIVAMSVGLQYFQMRQMNVRSKSMGTAQNVPNQMQTMQRIMPLFMALIYISIPAAVNVYFITSSLFRIAQQSYMYRYDKQIVETVSKLQERAKKGGGGGAPAAKVINTSARATAKGTGSKVPAAADAGAAPAPSGFMARFRDAWESSQQARSDAAAGNGNLTRSSRTSAAGNGTRSGSSSGGSRSSGPRSGGSRSTGAGGSGSGGSRAQGSRSQGSPPQSQGSDASRSGGSGKGGARSRSGSGKGGRGSTPAGTPGTKALVPDDGDTPADKRPRKPTR